MKKVLIGMILGLSSFFSQAAPTDCRQLTEDGEVDCIKATSWFNIGKPFYGTYEELLDYLKNNDKSCISNSLVNCYIQFENNPIEPPEGRILIEESRREQFTSINYNTSKDEAILLVQVYYSYLGNSLNEYHKKSRRIEHFRVCPENTTAISAGTDTYLKYCKPNPIPKNSSPSCDTGCNIGAGNVSVGN